MYVDQKIASWEDGKEVPILDGPIDVEAALITRPAAPILVIAQVVANAGLGCKEDGFAGDRGIQRQVVIQPQWGEHGAGARDEKRAAIGRPQCILDCFDESLPAVSLKEESQIAIADAPEHGIFSQEFLQFLSKHRRLLQRRPRVNPCGWAIGSLPGCTELSQEYIHVRRVIKINADDGARLSSGCPSR